MNIEHTVPPGVTHLTHPRPASGLEFTSMSRSLLLIVLLSLPVTMQVSLRIRFDEEVLQYALDIPREGRTFTIDGEGRAGDYLYLEATEDDEVVLHDIRVRFPDDKD